ncbi:unnamed protein product (macronuclear) [Paramecium tetraurelia]|uniref:Transmembrane protein n=1 Tax=Paramecium tetraurelia TaxID=5888 RepID=A0CFI0_PARTE|nr:uncharacterized protein GSPATT00037986001 [Paramecium tetraurelia]CAK69547.1 unnamed protein product [Paramecium tetraurelia]|eukprot:XP_001436944.1 hypothetical protein (macronuclear) [Paramecium tetraurelia strain d4-2]
MQIIISASKIARIVLLIKICNPIVEQMQTVFLFQFYQIKFFINQCFLSNFIQDCSIELHSYIFTTLTQNIYLSLHVNYFNWQWLHIIPQLQSRNTEFQIYFNIKYSNLALIKCEHSFIIFKCFKSIIQFSSFKILQPFIILSINLQELQIQQLSLQNFNLQSVNSLFYFEHTVQQQYIDINIDIFTIINSMIHNSNIILLDNQFQKTTNCYFNNILISNSNLYSSSFMKIKNNQYLVMQGSISQISIVFSLLSNIQPLFQTFCYKSLIISRISLTNSTFQNFILFQTTNEQINKDYQIQFCSLKNSSIINFVQDYQFQSIIFENIEVNQIQHDDKTILINLVSNDLTSTVKMSNIILDTITLYDNIQLVSNLQSISSIILIQSNIIEISDIKIIRSIGITEFLLSSAINLVLSNFTISLNSKYFFKSIIADEQCS